MICIITKFRKQRIRKTDQYGAYTENRIREITQDNIARFKKITEIDPDIAKLEKVLNIQEGEAGKRQMDALEAGFEEFNKYKQEHPGESRLLLHGYQLIKMKVA